MLGAFHIDTNFFISVIKRLKPRFKKKNLLSVLRRVTLCSCLSVLIILRTLGASSARSLQVTDDLWILMSRQS